jgi:G3E family GTPase
MEASAQTRPIPVTLITGFLGSGKTTQLNAVLRNPAFAGTLVIVNEFGDVGLDHMLMDRADDQVLLLDSGCLCCAATGNLRDTLIDLFVRRNTGAITAFDRIVIETSGLAHPGPLTATLIGDSALLSRCTLSQIVTIVDAANGAQTLSQYHEAGDQVAMADRLVIGKVDMASSGQIEVLWAMLAALNPHAPIHKWQIGQETSFIFAPESFAKPTVASEPEVWIENLMRSRQLASKETRASALWNGDVSSNRLSPFSHSSTFKTIHTHTLRFGQSPIDWPAYAALTQALSQTFGRQLLRCKGLLRLRGNELWVVQGVQGYFAKPTRLPGDLTWDQDSFLVCIGVEISAERLYAITAQSPELKDLLISSTQPLEKING